MDYHSAMAVSILCTISNSSGVLVPVRTSFCLRRRGGKTYNVKSVLADVSNVSPSSLL